MELNLGAAKSAESVCHKSNGNSGPEGPANRTKTCPSAEDAE